MNNMNDAAMSMHRPLTFAEIRTCLEAEHNIAQQAYLLAIKQAWEANNLVTKVSNIWKAKDAQRAANEAATAYKACLDVEAQLGQAAMHDLEGDMNGCYSATAKAANQFNIVIKGMEHVTSYIGKPNPYVTRAIEIQITPADKAAFTTPGTPWTERIIDGFHSFQDRLRSVASTIEARLAEIKDDLAKHKSMAIERLSGMSKPAGAKLAAMLKPATTKLAQILSRPTVINIMDSMQDTTRQNIAAFTGIGKTITIVTDVSQASDMTGPSFVSFEVDHTFLRTLQQNLQTCRNNKHHEIHTSHPNVKWGPGEHQMEDLLAAGTRMILSNYTQDGHIHFSSYTQDIERLDSRTLDVTVIQAAFDNATHAQVIYIGENMANIEAFLQDEQNSTSLQPMRMHG